MASIDLIDIEQFVEIPQNVKDLIEKNVSNSEYMREQDKKAISKIMNVKQIIDKHDVLTMKIHDIIQSIKPQLKRIDDFLSKQYCDVSILLSNEENPYDFLEKLPAKDIQASLSHESILVNSVDEFRTKIRNILVDYLESLEKETAVVDGFTSSNLNYSELN